MRDLLILLVHLIATLARLMGPGGLRSVVAESLLVKQQLLILNRSRQRAPNLRPSDRILAGVCALFMRPSSYRATSMSLGAYGVQLHEGDESFPLVKLFDPSRADVPRR